MTGRMLATGFILGPFNHYWYGLLDKLLPLRTRPTVIKKVLADQIFAAPCFAFSFYAGWY